MQVNGSAVTILGNHQYTQPGTYALSLTLSAGSAVTVDLSGSQSAVDATSLGISTTDILSGGVGISGNTQRIDAPGHALRLQVGFEHREPKWPRLPRLERHGDEAQAGGRVAGSLRLSRG